MEAIDNILRLHIHLENVNIQRLTTEVVLAFSPYVNRSDFETSVYDFIHPDQETVQNHKKALKVEKLYLRYLKYRMPKTQWWFLGYFVDMTDAVFEHKILDPITSLLQTDDTTKQSILTHFQRLDYDEFDPEKLFAYHKTWYRVSIDIPLDGIDIPLDGTVPITCEVKLTQEEHTALLATKTSIPSLTCKPIRQRHYEINRALVDFVLKDFNATQ